MFNRLLHWLKTGEKLEVKPHLEIVPDLDGPKYTIQIKEDLITKRYLWRVLRDGKEFNYSRVWTQGTAFSKPKAKWEAQNSINEIHARERQKSQQWEDA